MDKSELRIYKTQIIALILLYVACIIPLIYTHPRTASMDCNDFYKCTVQMEYFMNIKQSADLYISKDVKIRFYDGDNYHSGFINIYNDNNTINADPFGTDEFYVCSYGETQEMYNKINNDIERFNKYLKNPKENFHISKDYDNTRFNIIGLILTLIFLCFASTKQPITNLFKILGIKQRK